MEGGSLRFFWARYLGTIFVCVLVDENQTVRVWSDRAQYSPRTIPHVILGTDHLEPAPGFS